MAQIIQLRRDYSSNWTLANPVLAQGELGIEFDNYNVKIGNGLSSWNELPYGLGTASLPVHTHPYAGTGITTASITGIDIAGTLNSNGLSLAIPAWLTTYSSAAGGGDWTAATVSGTDMLVSTGAGTNTIYYPKYITTAADINHTHSQYLTTAMVSEAGSNFIGTTYTSHTHDYQTTGNYLTTAMLSNMTSVLQYTSNTSNITSNAVNTSVTSAYQLIANSTASLGTIYTSHTHNYQSTGAYLTTAALSDHAHTVYLSTAALSNHTHSEYVNTSISSQWLTTAMASQNTSLFAYTSNSSLLQHTSATSAITASALNTSVSGSFQLTANNSLSLGTGYTTHTHNYQSTGDYLTTAALSDHTHSNLYIALGNSTAYQTSVLSGTFQTTGAYLTTAMASGNTSLYMSTSERGNYFYTSNNTFANNTHVHGGLAINATNISTSITSASNGLTINLSVAAPGEGGGGAALQGSGTYTQNSGTIQFANSNNITFGLTNNQMTASVPAGTVNFADSNGITWGSSTAVGNTTITGSVNAGAGGVAVVASNTTYTSGSVSFRGTNVTIGTSAGGQFIDLSVAAPGGAVYTDMEWHNFTGNSTHAAPGQNTIWYQPFELKNPVSASSIQIGMTFNGTSTSAATQQFGMTHDFMILARHSTNSTRFDSIWSTRNELTVWASGTTSGSYSSNNGGNSLSNGSRLLGSYIYGQRIISNAIGSELSAGFYMFAYRQSTSSAVYSAFMRSYNPVFVAPLPQAKNFIGFQTNTSIGHFIGGPYSVSSNDFPASIGVSELRKSNDLRLFFKIGASS